MILIKILRIQNKSRILNVCFMTLGLDLHYHGSESGLLHTWKEIWFDSGICQCFCSLNIQAGYFLAHFNFSKGINKVLWFRLIPGFNKGFLPFLSLKMPIVSFFFTLFMPFKMYDGHTRAGLHNQTQSALSWSHHT